MCSCRLRSLWLESMGTGKPSSSPCRFGLIPMRVSLCNVNCTGNRTRTRSQVVAQAGAGDPCPPLVNTTSCSGDPFICTLASKDGLLHWRRYDIGRLPPVLPTFTPLCVMEAWAPWSTCSLIDGAFTHSRTRSVLTNYGDNTSVTCAWTRESEPCSSFYLNRTHHAFCRVLWLSDRVLQASANTMSCPAGRCATRSVEEGRISLSLSNCERDTGRFLRQCV